MEKFNKMDALKYLVKNNVEWDEWSGAAMFGVVSEVIESESEFFTEDELELLLKKASDF